MRYFILFVLNILLLGQLAAQQSKKGQQPIANLNLAARYNVDEHAVELRFVPTKKSVLLAGVKNGFVIERATITGKVTKESDIKYRQIGTVQSFTSGQWDAAIAAAAGDTELKDRLEMARNFVTKPTAHDRNKPKMEEGFAGLRKAKNSEEFGYVLLVLSAIQKKEVAEAMGLSFFDHQVKEGVKYVYRVNLKQYKGPYKVIPVPFIVTTDAKSAAVNRKVDVYEGDEELVFSWEENDMLSGVFVERKNDLTGVFEPMNDLLKLSLSEGSFRNGFKDSMLVNYHKYQYRLYGMNVFGEKVLFAEVTAMPRDRTPPHTPLMQSAKHVAENEVVVTWKPGQPVDADLKGFKILRGESVDGHFKPISDRLLNKNATTFTDRNFIRGGKNFYKVQAVDTAGNYSTSFSAYATLIDTVPPAIPRVVSAEMDSTGIVTIVLAKNKEKDLMGYRLFWANDPSHEFAAIQEGFDSRDTTTRPVQLVFKDTVTLNTLTGHVYYKVKALDYHYNQSGFSKLIDVKRVDIIPPTTPVFKNVVVDKDAIHLTFALSQSTDVKTQYLYRKTAHEDSWRKIATLKNGQTNYVDKNLQTGMTYYYSLRAMDSSNLYSDYATPVYGKPFDTGQRPKVKDFKLKKKGDSVVLTWCYPNAKKGTYFVIYKTNRKGHLVEYKKTDKMTFSEKISKKGQHYAVRAFTKDGGLSPMSDTLSASL